MLDRLIAKFRRAGGMFIPAPPAAEQYALHRFVLRLEPSKLERPVLGEVLTVRLPCALEIAAVYHGLGALVLDEVGFVRLRDRKPYPLHRDAVLLSGKSLQLAAPDLENHFGLEETLAPYVRTAEGRFYYEQPFALVRSDRAGVLAPLSPDPPVLKAEARPPSPAEARAWPFAPSRPDMRPAPTIVREKGR